MNKVFTRIIASADARALFFLAAFPFLFFLPATLGQGVFGASDLYTLFYPNRLEYARALSENRLPLWTTGIGAGFPLFADGEIGALYPLNLFLHRFLPMPLAFNYSIIFHYAWAGIGMYLFCRAHALRAPAALLAAFAFSFSGFFLAQMIHPPLIASAAWLPWLLFFQLKYLRGGARIWFVAASAAIGLMLLAGKPQIALYNLIAYAAVGIAHPFFAGKINARVFIKPFAFVVASAALGAGIAAAQLLPMFELVSQSIREPSEEFFASYSLDPAALAQFIAPPSLGNPLYVLPEYWGYVGVLPLALALFAVFAKRDRRVIFFAAFALFALVAALGSYTPLARLLFQIPLLNIFRVPARFLLLFTFAVAFLAAMGLNDLLARLNHAPRARRAEIILAAIFAALIAGALALTRAQSVDFWLDAWAVLPIILWLGALALGFAAWRRWLTARAFAALALGIVIFDLTAFAAPLASGVNATIAPAEMMAIPNTVRALSKDARPYRVLADRALQENFAAMRAGLTKNRALVYGKESAEAYVALILKRNFNYLRAMSPAMLSLLNVRYYLAPLEPHTGEPFASYGVDVLNERIDIPPTAATRVEIVSFADNARNLPDGFLAGEVIVELTNGETRGLPLRLGIETADWMHTVSANVQHRAPAAAMAFSAFHSAVGRAFEGRKYIARFDFAPANIVAVRAQSFLPAGDLTIERVALGDAVRMLSLASLARRNDFDLVFKSHLVSVWENRNALPRAFIAHEAEIVEDAQVLARMRDANFRAEQIALLSEGKPLAASAGAPALSEATIVEYNAERVVVRARTDSPGYLVLADTWYPGWVARVDGQAAPIVRADFLFRAVYVEAGEYKVVFEFQPASFSLGIVVSLISMVALLAMVKFLQE